MTLREWIAEHNEEALVADGFDDACLGIVERCSQPALACYDVQKCIEILMQRDGMDEDDAAEYFNFNVIGAWVGPHTPVFLWRRGDEP